MWQQYCKTFFPVQVLIALLSSVALLAMKMPLIAVILGIVLPMEGAAFIGAAWAYRLKRKIEMHNEQRPSRPLF
jgi:hypothetical protein